MNPQKMKQQLVFLFLSNFAILFTGMGLFPILPLYAARFSASTAMIGLYMALTYISITAGTMLTGWLAGRVARKSLFLAAGLAGIPAIVGMGQATNFTQVVILTGVIWFTGGIGLSLVNVFTGLVVDQKQRGKAFSFLALASPMGAIFGGLVIGRLAEWQGYPVMFAVLATVWSIWPILAMWKIEDITSNQPRTRVKSGSQTGLFQSGVFTALLAAVLLSAITISVGRLGLSLVMKSQSFSLSAISSTSLVSGLVAIPFILLTGSAADRYGHQFVLVLGYLVSAAGALSLIFASQLWQFWMAAILLLVAMNSNRSLAAATAAGMLPPDELAHKLPWIATANWMAGIIGYASAGFIIEAAGVTLLFSLAATLSIAATLLTLAPRISTRAAELRLAAAHAVALFQRPTSDPQPCHD